MTCQEQFEAWAQAAPREWSIEKQSELGAFPGQYRDCHVYAAWEAWETRSIHAELANVRLVEALKNTLLFLERFSHRWDGTGEEHPVTTAEKARAALADAEASHTIKVEEER